MKVYAYLRVSGKGQIEGDGFRRQEQSIMDFCQKASMDVVEVFREEGISGTTDESSRPAFQAMLAAILSNGVRMIVVEGLDRIAREYRVQESLLIYLASKGVGLIDARTGENVVEAIMADPMKKALVQIQGVFAELEKSLLVKKLRLAREAKRKAEGKCEGRKSTKELTPSVIQAIKSLRKAQVQAKAIAHELNEKGFTTSTGRLWTAGNVANICQRFAL